MFRIPYVATLRVALPVADANKIGGRAVFLFSQFEESARFLRRWMRFSGVGIFVNGSVSPRVASWRLQDQVFKFIDSLTNPDSP